MEENIRPQLPWASPWRWDQALNTNADREMIIVNENKINPEKKQKTSSPFLSSSYVKCYSETRFDVITFDFTWKIEQFTSLLKIVDVIESPSFPETNEYKIEMHLSHETESDKNELTCYIRTQRDYSYSAIVKKTFNGFCTITVMDSCKTVILSKSISGRITDMTSLITIPKSRLKFNHPDTLIIHWKFENFVKPINNTIHLNLYPTALKDVKPPEDSTAESEFTKDEKSIKFIVGEEQYVVSKNLLRATKSSYFTYICRTHEGKEKNMTNDLITNNELQAFKQILSFILTGSISDLRDCDMLKMLLVAADKYDVPILKLTCEHHLLRNITIETAVELMQLAFSSNATFLKTHLATFIKFHMKEIAESKEFRTLSQEDLNKIIELIEKSKIFEGSTYCSFVKTTCEDFIKN